MVKFINYIVLPPRSAAIKTRGIAQLTSTRYAKANEPSIAPNLAAIRVTAIAVPRTDVGNSSIPDNNNKVDFNMQHKYYVRAYS